MIATYLYWGKLLQVLHNIETVEKTTVLIQNALSEFLHFKVYGKHSNTMHMFTANIQTKCSRQTFKQHVHVYGKHSNNVYMLTANIQTTCRSVRVH